MGRLGTDITSWIAVAIIGLLLAATSNAWFLAWGHTSSYHASSFFGAEQPLMWIQEAQAACLSSRGEYCLTIPALLDTDVHTEGRAKVEQQVHRAGPGGDGSPSRYRFHLDAAPTTYKATASCCADHTHGPDVWAIGPSGDPTPIQRSAVLEQYHYGTAARWATLGLMAVLFGLLAWVAWRWWEDKPGLLRAGIALVFAGVGTLLPVLVPNLLLA